MRGAEVILARRLSTPGREDGGIAFRASAFEGTRARTAELSRSDDRQAIRACPPDVAGRRSHANRYQHQNMLR